MMHKNRVAELEEELAKTREEKTDQTFEIRRLANEKDKLEAKLKEVQTESVKNQGNSQTSSATVGRLQSQLQGQKNDHELMMTQKTELEKVIKAQKHEILDAEKKSQDYYAQLLSTKENFQILHNEQKLLSDEITQKQTELQKAEREKLNQERELLQLRPLQQQLENFSESNRAQIQANVRTEFEFSKAQKSLVDL